MADKGMASARAFFNARTGDRYTGIFCFEGSQMRNIWLFDLQGQHTASFATSTLRPNPCRKTKFVSCNRSRRG